MFAVRSVICRLLVIILNVMMSDSCNVFKSISIVTMDTRMCSFQNFTQPVSKWICVTSCKKHPYCTGVLFKQDLAIHWCCLVTEPEIQYRKPGNMVLYYKNYTPIKCQTGWTGRKCDACAPNFEPPGQCNQCLRGFDGDNCDKCVTNFGPDGQCDKCILGWTGNNCDVCDFGFSTESNCTECIQNGHWTGTYSQPRAPLRAYLTFDGPACTTLVPGTTVTYNTFNRQVTGGNYDNTTGTLNILDNYNNPVGSVNATNKRISGRIYGYSFTLNYQG